MANVKISNLSTIWTSSAAELTAIKMDVTDTASSGSSKLMDLMVGSVSKVTARKDGVMTATSFVGQHTGSLFGTSSFSVSSSVSVYSSTASYASSAISASFSQQSNQSVTASHSLNGLSSSYSSYSGQSNTSLSSSQSTWSNTASYALNAGSSAGTTLNSGSSHNITASWSVSSSYALNSSGGTTLESGSSYNITASRSISASFAHSASSAITASFALSAIASLSSGSSYNITASRAVTASYVLSSSYAVTASFAERYAPYWPSNVEISGSGLTPSVNNILNYVVTSGSFTLIANSLGSEPKYYRWYINSSSLLQSGSSNSFNATSSRKDLHSGIFTCNVTNSYGNATSQNFQVQVLDPVVLVSETPPDPTPAVNSMVYFIVSATGDAVRYRWKKRGTTPALDAYVVDGVPSILNEGYASSTLTIQAISPESEGSYFCEISNSVSNTSSSNMLIYVTAPRIVTQPEDLDTFGMATVLATGSAISYSWQYNGIDIVEQTAATLNLSTAVNANYFTQPMMDQLYSLRCKVYNGVGYNFSDSIQVKPFKKAGVALSGHAGSATRTDHFVVAIDAASQIIAPVGTAYTVVKNNVNVGSDVTALGESTPKLTLHNVQSSDAGTYAVSASFNGLSVTSDAISLTIAENASYHNAFPLVRYVFDDETHTLVADYGMSLGTTYNGPGGTPPGTYYIGRAIRQSQNFTAYDQADLNGSVSCPDAAMFPTTLGFPTSTVTITGRNISGSSSSGSTSIFYQYAYSYTLASCPTNSVSTPNPWPCVHPDTLADTCSGGQTATSAANLMTVTVMSFGNLGITVHPTGSQSKATGSAVVLRTVGTAGGADLHYRWYRNGVRIPDSDSSLYSISSVALSDTGSYYCIVGAKSTLSYRTMQSSASILNVV